MEATTGVDSTGEMRTGTVVTGRIVRPGVDVGRYKGRLRRSVSALLGMGLIVGLGGPASAATTGLQRFTIVFAGPEGDAGRVVATGVINGIGSNPAAESEQELIFPGGTILLHSELTGGSGSFNPRGCVGRGTSSGTVTVTGGTGEFVGATGGGTFTGAGTSVAKRLPGGGCSETEVSKYGTVHITATLTVPAHS